MPQGLITGYAPVNNLDPGWDSSFTSDMRLAILPGMTHYNILGAPSLAAVVADFIG